MFFFCENPTIFTDCTLCFPLFSHFPRPHESCKNVLHPFFVFHLFCRFVAYTFNLFQLTISMLSVELCSFTTLFRIHGNPGKVSVVFFPPNFQGNLQNRCFSCKGRHYCMKIHIFLGLYTLSILPVYAYFENLTDVYFQVYFLQYTSSILSITHPFFSLRCSILEAYFFIF